MRALIVIALVVFAFGAAWTKYVTNGGLMDYYDNHPRDGNGAVVMYCLGKGYEIVGGWDKVLAADSRIVDRYPHSSYAEEAQFGVALAYEKTNHYPEAIAAYQKFLDAYPNSKYANSVRNNIEILKSR